MDESSHTSRLKNTPNPPFENKLPVCACVCVKHFTSHFVIDVTEYMTHVPIVSVDQSESDKNPGELLHVI